MTDDYEHWAYKSLHSACMPLGRAVGIKEHKFSPPKVTKILTQVASFPLGSALSKSCGPRSILLGDAAHRCHPMAGQGANMGYRDVEILLGRFYCIIN